MKPIQLAAGAVLGLGLLGLGVAGINYTPEERPSVQFIDTSLADGKAEFTKDGETDSFTYTIEDTSDKWGSVRFEVTFSDGVTVTYNFLDRGFRDGGDNKGLVELDGTNLAQFTWDRETLVVTTSSGAITRLGGFKSHYTPRSQYAKGLYDEFIARQEAERIARERRERELNREDFDGAMRRLGREVCAVAETLRYINSRNVSAAADKIVSNFEMSQANAARWNRMSPQLRWQRIQTRMNWDCNDVAMAMHQQDIQDRINGAIIWDHIFN